jgi:hypothetical protein
VGAETGGPPLVIGCCGSPWAADRPPPKGRRPACGERAGALPGGVLGPPDKALGLGGCFGLLATVDDDLFDVAGRVSSPDYPGQ